jgi:hypothetical protein
MGKEDKTTIEVNGIKLELDMRYAKRIDTFRIGTPVKILVKNYDSVRVRPGVVVGFEPFKELPTIVVAYIEEDWKSANIKFAHINKNTKDVGLVPAVKDDLLLDRERVIAMFDREVKQKEREIAEIEDKKQYFLTNFGTFWNEEELV